MLKNKTHQGTQTFIYRKWRILSLNLYRWLRDRTFRDLIKNAGILLGGNIVTAVLSLLSLTLSARSLGPEQFGVLVMIQAYVVVIDNLVNSQSWQALIKYGSEVLERKPAEELKGLLKFGFLLDAGMALLGTVIASLGSLYCFGHFLGWSSETAMMATLYSVVILFNVRGAPIAILRLFNHFNLYALVEVMGASFKLVGVFIAFLIDAKLWLFLVIWLSAEIFRSIMLLAAGCWVLRKQGIRGVMTSTVRGISRRCEGLWGFICVSNLNSTSVRVLMRLDVLIVGYLLGTADAGFFRIIKSFGAVVTKFGNPLRQVIYPTLTRFVASDAYPAMKQFLFKVFTSLVATGGLVWIGFLVIGNILLTVTVGNDYTVIYPETAVYLLGSVIGMSMLPINPLMMALGLHKELFMIYQVACISYIIAICIGAQYNLVGATGAFIIFHLSFLISYLAFILIKKEGKHYEDYKKLHPK